MQNQFHQMGDSLFYALRYHGREPRYDPTSNRKKSSLKFPSTCPRCDFTDTHTLNGAFSNSSWHAESELYPGCTQVQLDNVSAKRYQGSSHAARCIVREHGIRGLYLGHMVNTSREVLFLAAYFGTYEHSRYAHPSQEHGFVSALL